MNKTKCWIEAMRLRTLPVSLAGVVMAYGYARLHNCVDLTVCGLCLVFATLAQISSNFANEYFDYRDGLDRPGREGPRRGVTEGDITPRAMLIATLATLGAACLTGCMLLLYGPWWLILAGIAIAVGVMAYSTGPYPLSRHGLGEVAVVLFFGVAPVCLTFFIQSGTLTDDVLYGSIAAGLMGANVLIVNNYRDEPDDRTVGKHTLAVIIGRKWMPLLYCLNGVAAVGLTALTWIELGTFSWIIPGVYLLITLLLTRRLTQLRGRALTPLLGMTAVAMAAVCAAFAIIA